MPRNQFQRMVFAFLTVVVTVHAYVFYSLYVVNGSILMEVNQADSVIHAIDAQGGVYMLGCFMPIWAVILIEFCFAYILEVLVGSPCSFKLACKVFNPSKNHPMLFETGIIMKKVITISRQFGSAGRSIGKAVAEKLGYAYYDKEIIEKLAEQTGLSKSYIENAGEYAGSSNIFSYAFVGRTIEGQSVEDYLWQKQRELILKIAENGNCVIVGRCADYILKNREDALHIFIHSDKEKRAKRIVELYGETNIRPEKRLMDKDKKRAANYKYYTDTIWGMSENYNVSLDSGVIGIDRCIDFICELTEEL